MSDAIVEKSTGKVLGVIYGIDYILKDTEVLINDVSEEVDFGYKYNFDTKTFLKSNEKLFKEVREKRNILLINSDYTQLPDSTYPSTQDAWKIYRQQLRDITKGVTDPDTITFPEEPK